KKYQERVFSSKTIALNAKLME
ncbi:hypothetical protein NR595_003449, partial [Acinetobacter baumannii]